MLRIKTPIKLENVTFYKYILIDKKMWFGEVKNLADPFYSLSSIHSCLDTKRALNFEQLVPFTN